MRRLLLVVSLVSATLSAQTTAPYLNPSLPAEERARDLVARMTLEEKVSQTLDQAVAIPRLGVPAYGWWNEALHGDARAGFATTFPQAIGMAAAWDVPLMQRVGEIIATEGRAKYNEALHHDDHSRYHGLTFWSPNINIFRDPRWGRGQETYGEDPFLTARLGVAFIRGVQGNDPHYLKAVATPKHFAVHSGPESTRHHANVDPSPFDLEDTYLPAFRAAITESHADSIMCAYNAVDRSPACANDLLLQQRLRGAWHFNGYVVSDCDAVADIYTGHKAAADAEHASAAALKAGTDLDCGSAYKALAAAVQHGLVPADELDAALVRLFTARVRLGMFDPADKVSFNTIPYSEVDSPEHRKIALQMARESIVLLQNRNAALPLKSPKKIAVIGPTAELIQVLEGNYSATAPHPVLPLEGIEKQFPDVTITFAPGALLAEGFLTPVPSSALNGLRGEYFDNFDFSGTPRFTRTERRVNFHWAHVAPDEAMKTTKFSVRWTCTFTPPGVGAYTLAFRGLPREPKPGAKVSANKSSVKLYIDDKLLLEAANGRPSAEVNFTDIKPHALRIEYVRASDDEYVELDWLAPADALRAQAAEAARSSDIVIAFAGLSPDLEGEEMSVKVPGFNGGDRVSIDLPATQEEMLKVVKATGKPLIVVLATGSAVATNWAAQNADAVLEAWYSGEEGGTAIAETLAGTNNPSGRLPITFYRDVKDLPAFDDYSMKNRTYRYFGGEALYPFGHGLSFTTFEYSALKLPMKPAHAGDGITAGVTVKNTGSRAGDEVIELYLDAPGSAKETHPFLAGTQRVHLTAGESRDVTLLVDPRQLSRVTPDGKRHISSGHYTVSVGGGQPRYSAHVSGVVTVTGETELPQ